MFGRLRSNCGQCGCSADACGCAGESFYHSDHSTQYWNDSAIPSGEYHVPQIELDEPMIDDAPPSIEQSLPVNPNQDVPNALPMPMDVPGSETANFHGTIRPISFEVPAINFIDLRQ